MDFGGSRFARACVGPQRFRTVFHGASELCGKAPCDARIEGSFILVHHAFRHGIR